MSDLLVRVSPVQSRQAWLRAAKSCISATFFHTPYWQDLALASGRGFRDASLELTLADGRVAYLPLTQIGTRAGGLLRRCISTFAGCYGGLVSSAPVGDAELAIQRYLIRRRYASISWVGNPLALGAPVLPAFRRTPLSTHVLRLDSDFDGLVRNFSKGHRAAYKKGLRLGMVVRRATPEDETQYLRLYERALERWGARASSRYSADFFRRIFELARTVPEHVSVWVSVAEGSEVVAGGVFFYWNDHVGYWHGVSNPTRYSDSATTALLGEVIKDACARGLTLFDFNPSGGHDGVAAFKRHFGAEELELGRAEYTSPLLRLLDFRRGAR